MESSSISDHSGASSSYQNVNNATDYSVESDEFVHPRESGTVELAKEHGAYEAPVIPRYRRQYDENLEHKLILAKAIWSQLEREARLESLGDSVATSSGKACWILLISSEMSSKRAWTMEPPQRSK
jgi:hypothetical protein